MLTFSSRTYKNVQVNSSNVHIDEILTKLGSRFSNLCNRETGYVFCVFLMQDGAVFYSRRRIIPYDARKWSTFEQWKRVNLYKVTQSALRVKNVI